MMYIQLPTGKTAKVDEGFWLTASDEEIDKFFERNVGSEFDPLSEAPVKGGEELSELSEEEKAFIENNEEYRMELLRYKRENEK